VLTFLGALSALSSSLIWAWSSVLFSKVVAHHGAMVVGLVKSLIAVVFLGVTVVVVQAPFPASPEFVALALSGIIGMGLGDVAYLRALRDAGVRQTTLLHSTSPLFLLGYELSQGADLKGRTILAVLLMTVGVMDVTRRRLSNSSPRYPFPIRGAVLGLLSAICQAAGILLAKGATDTVGPFSAATVRITAAAGAIALAFFCLGRARELIGSFRPTVLRDAALPSFFGTYVGVLLMMTAIRLTEPSVSGALLSLTPLFAIPVSARLLGEPIRPEVLPGSILCVIGVCLL
jgi:drug/metabolite transporter (DMT)-like permease